MAPQKLKVNMLGVASGKELAGIPVGDESAEERVLALLGHNATEDAYQVSGLFNLFHIERYCDPSLQNRSLSPPRSSST
jgi:hypothetical protein